MVINIRNFTQKLFVFFIPLVMIVYYLIMRGINLNSFIILPSFFLFAIAALKVATTSTKSRFIVLLNTFVVYCLITALWYIFNDAPFACFVAGFKVFLFPMVFAYLGFNDKGGDKFNKWFMYGCLFCFLMGLYLYIAVPAYYSEYLMQNLENSWNMSTENRDVYNVIDYTRFGSFLGSSYAIQYFGIPALIMAFVYAVRGNVQMNKWLIYTLALVAFVASILSQQRMAIAWAFFVPIFVGAYNATKGNFKVLKIVIISLIVIIALAGTVMSLERFDVVSEMVGNRFDNMNFAEAMDARDGQVQNFSRGTAFSLIFGLGLGSCSSQAGAFGLQGVYDSEFPKIFFELGFVGITLFLSVILPTILRGLKYFKYLYMELMIVMFYLVAGIGSDSLTFFIYDVMFWYSVGRIWNTYHLQQQVSIVTN